MKGSRTLLMFATRINERVAHPLNVRNPNKQRGRDPWRVVLPTSLGVKLVEGAEVLEVVGGQGVVTAGGPALKVVPVDGAVVL
jgi:hypothetical protein